MRAQITLDVTGLSAAEVEDIRSHIKGKQDGPETYEPPPHGWTCFICGETFRSHWGARLHFGRDPMKSTLCVSDPEAAERVRRRAS